MCLTRNQVCWQRYRGFESHPLRHDPNADSEPMPYKPKVVQPENIPVREFYETFKDELKLEILAGKDGLDKVIGERSVNRPALALVGHYKYFANQRIQLFGAGEMAFFEEMHADEQTLFLRDFASREVPCIITSSQAALPGIMVEVADEFSIPLIRTSLSSKLFVTHATVLLEERMAPYTTLHGTLLDIRGIGTLIRGKSGVGKSECALALIERNHSLVADDRVRIRLVSDHELVGKLPDMRWWGYMECRGIGIINIRDLFGIRAVRQEKRIDFIITFTYWKEGMNEERTGLTQDYEEILGVKVPHMELPVRPGRDMARIAEVAAMVQAQKLSGHDSAQAFNELLLRKLSAVSETTPPFLGLER